MGLMEWVRLDFWIDALNGLMGVAEVWVCLIFWFWFLIWEIRSTFWVCWNFWQRCCVWRFDHGFVEVRFDEHWFDEMGSNSFWGIGLLRGFGGLWDFLAWYFDVGLRFGLLELFDLLLEGFDLPVNSVDMLIVTLDLLASSFSRLASGFNKLLEASLPKRLHCGFIF